MLETLRNFAREGISSPSDFFSLSQRHAQYYGQFFEKAGLNWFGPDETAWIRQMEMEHGNLQAALEWALNNDQYEIAFHYGGMLWNFWYVRGYVNESRNWLERAMPHRHLVSPSVLIDALNGAGILAWSFNDYVQARTFLQERLVLSREAGDLHRIGTTFSNLGLVAEAQGDFDQAMAFYKEAASVQQEEGGPIKARISIGNQGNLALRLGDYDQAKFFLEESLALEKEFGDKEGVASKNLRLAEIALRFDQIGFAEELCSQSLKIFQELDYQQGLADALSLQGILAQKRGNINQATILFYQSLTIAQAVQDDYGIAKTLEALAKNALNQEEGEFAARFIGCIEAIHQKTPSLTKVEQAELDGLIAMIQDAVGTEGFFSARGKGYGMPVKQILNEYLNLSKRFEKDDINPFDGSISRKE